MINKKTILKIIAILVLTMQMINILGGLNISKANIQEGQDVTLLGDHECDSLVEFYMTNYNRWSYKVIWYVYYLDEQTQEKYPAFCVEPTKNGIGITYDSYNTAISKEYDNCLWRILSKGYMGSKYTDWTVIGDNGENLGQLECDDDLYSATKIAIHSYKEGVAPQDKYIVGNRSVDGIPLEEIERRGAKVLKVAQILYEYGLTGKEVYEQPQVSVQKNGESKTEIINGVEYYVQNYKVTANKNLKSYNISIENFVSGTKILDSNNNEISNMASNYFKIAIPTKNINEEINGKIYIKNAQIETYPIYYCKSYMENSQSYVTYTSSCETAETSINMSVNPNNSNLIITKVDSETKLPMENVIFRISNEKNEIIGEYTTNEKGVIELKNIKQGVINIKEISTVEGYILNENEVQLELNWGETKKITLENEKKKGSLKIVKVDKDDNEIKLDGVEFELYNENDELIQTLVTDQNGEIEVNDLEIGNYKLKETKTKENYVLDEEEKEIIIKWNEENEQILENEKKKGSLKIVKVDKDNNEIKLDGVEFELYNENDELIQTFVTDQNGEIEVSNLEIGNYKLKETKTKENYILNDEKIDVIIEYDKETLIEITNSQKELPKLPRTGF
jgi:uncharacterized surface anchored protein